MSHVVFLEQPVKHRTKELLYPSRWVYENNPKLTPQGFFVTCLEYVVVHEMVHLLEHTHNNRFTNLMDQFMPQWRFCRAELNRLPVRHDDWLADEGVGAPVYADESSCAS